MPGLQRVSGQNALRAFQRLGWEYKHHTGSHMILVKEGSVRSLSVPDHKELAKGTLRALIRMAGISVDDFNKAL
jgi:predicted RNA binding protein YcfA (HicA-like mRNA interferase family)